MDEYDIYTGIEAQNDPDFEAEDMTVHEYEEIDSEREIYTNKN